MLGSALLVFAVSDRITGQSSVVRQIVVGNVRWNDLDLAYAAGLYDYLQDRFAAALTRELFGMLRSGGRLLIANMTSAAGAGYLEAYMDWWMTYRDEAALMLLIEGVPAGQLASTRTFRDETGHIVFLEAVRA